MYVGAGELPFIDVMPELWVAAKDQRQAESILHAEKQLLERLINSSMDEVRDVDARWARRDDFSGQALEMGAQLLGLDQETPYPLG